MTWLTKELQQTSNDLANSYPLTDGRDLKAPMKAVMTNRHPGLFDVDDKILDDPRTKLGFMHASRNMKMAALKPYHREPGMPWPGIVSVDPRFDAFKYDVAYNASKDWKPNIDEAGFADETAVVRDFSGLLTATGVKMWRANAPMADRSKLLDDLGYSFDFKSTRHRRIARALHSIMFGERKDASFKFQVRSSTTMPSGYGGPGSQAQKQYMCRRNLQNAESILDWVANKDMSSLFSEAGMYFAASTGERAQAEGVASILDDDLTPKARVVNDPLYATSGGREGTRQAADKTRITRDMFDLKYGIGARIRTVYAVCGEISYFMSPFFVGCRENYFTEYAYTWHHTSADQIFEGIQGFEEIVGLDVTLMDQNMPKFFLDAHADWLEDYFDPRFAQLIRWVNGIPYYAPQLAAGDKPFWVGDPRRPGSFDVDVGLSSGRADNPDLGKWYMTTVYFCLMDDYLHDVLEQAPNDKESIKKVLKGEHPVFGLKDMGDDAILGFRHGYAALATKVRTDLAEAGKTGKAGLSPYAILDAETGVAFLGNVIVKDRAGRLIKPKPNPVTFLVNQHCPERSINGPYSQYWGHGYVAALEHYSRAGSIIGELRQMVDYFWRKHLPGVPTPEQMAFAARRALPLPAGEIRTEADLEVLLDPSKLYYKYSTEGDVSPDIDALFRSTIEADFIEQTIGKYWR